MPPPKSLMIKAIDEDRARSDGSKKLHVPKEDLAAEIQSPGNYKVTVLRLPGKIKVTSTPDSMRVLISELEPPFGDGKFVDMAWVKRELKELDISYGIDDAAIEQAISECNQNKRTVKNILIGKGTPPGRGEDAAVDIRFDITTPEKAKPNAADRCKYLKTRTAMPGDVLIIKKKATAGTPGKDICGNEIRGISGTDIVVTRGDNIQVRATPDGKEEYVASTYGLIHFKKNELSIMIPTQTAQDKSRATIDIIPTSCTGTNITLDHIRDALKKDGITHGIQEFAIQKEFIRCATEHVASEDFEAARQQQPQKGTDARLCFAETPQELTELKAGLIRKGQAIAQKIAATKGIDGFTVNGNRLAAPNGQDFKITIVGDIDVKSDAAGEIYCSKTNGYAIAQKGKVEVRPIVKTSADGLFGRVDLYPKFLDGSPLTTEFVQTCLADARITNGIDNAEISREVAKTISGDQGRTDIILARGVPAKDGENGKAEYHFKKSQPGMRSFAIPGETLVTLHPPTKFTPGFDVFGKVLKGEDGERLSMSCGEGLSLKRQADDIQTIEVTSFGIISEDNGELFIRWPVEISEGDMEAYAPLSQKTALGSSIPVAVVIDALKEQGITFGICELQMNKYFAGESAGNADSFLAAKAKAPIPPQNGRLECLFAFNNLFGNDLLEASDFKLSSIKTVSIAQPGSTLVNILPGKPGIPGRTVKNVEIPVDPPAEPEIQLGENVKKSEDGSGYVSTLDTPGIVDFTDHRLSVVSPFRVSEDQLSVLFTLYPASSTPSGKPAPALNRADLENIIRVKNFRATLDEESFKEANKKLESTREPISDIPLLIGTFPKGGDDESITYHIQTGLTAGKMTKNQSIDYRERGKICNPKKGERLLSIKAATQGEYGYDVFGNIVSPASGKTVPIKAGQGVEVVQTADGRDFIAACDGTLFLTEQICDVTDSVVIEGDVNFETGNIRNNSGSVFVKGTVRAGFVVEASGAILIENLVENGIVQSRKEVIIKGGIIGDQAHVTAGSATEAYLLNHGFICSTGTVTIHTETQYAEILSDDCIMLESRNGRAIGGKLCAKNKLRLPMVGTDATSVTTTLMVGRSFATEYLVNRQCDLAAKQLENTNFQIKKIENALSSIPSVASFTIQQQIQIDRTKHLLATLHERHRRLEESRARLLQTVSENRRAVIEVTGKVFPGTAISIFGRRIVLREPAESVAFFYDEDNDKIGFRSLSRGA